MPMKRRALQAALVAEFERRCREYEDKYQRHMAELQRIFDSLCASFGLELVSARLDGTNPSSKSSGHANSVNSSPAVLTKTRTSLPAKTKRRRRRATPRNGNELSMTDLKPHVLQAVESMRGLERFTRHDVTDKLSRMSVAFMPNHVSLILSRLLDGIVVVGKQPRDGKKGAPLNLYKVTGRLGWKDTSTKSKKKRRSRK